MELFATGFNAWNQLDFEKSKTLQDEPEDLREFKKVLKSNAVQQLYASVSCTLVQTSSEILLAGYPDEWMELHELRDKILSSQAAIAGNGVVAVYDGHETVNQYPSLAHFKANDPQHTFIGLETIVQLVAYETGFAALSRQGQVWTWGDERYCACLGREDSKNPAYKPGLATELEELPTGRIRKLAAGGYMSMALTEGDDLYVWGGHPGWTAVIEDISGVPSPVLVEEKDILDCAVGESHAIVLSSDGNVYVIGENDNGQLGAQVEKTKSWMKVSWNRHGSSASGVVAGPRNSFIIANGGIP